VLARHVCECDDISRSWITILLNGTFFGRLYPAQSVRCRRAVVARFLLFDSETGIYSCSCPACLARLVGSLRGPSYEIPIELLIC
jgi:hypothetical protein